MDLKGGRGGNGAYGRSGGAFPIEGIARAMAFEDGGGWKWHGIDVSLGGQPTKKSTSPKHVSVSSLPTPPPKFLRIIIV